MSQEINSYNQQKNSRNEKWLEAKAYLKKLTEGYIEEINKHLNTTVPGWNMRYHMDSIPPNQILDQPIFGYLEIFNVAEFSNTAAIRTPFPVFSKTENGIEDRSTDKGLVEMDKKIPITLVISFSETLLITAKQIGQSEPEKTYSHLWDGIEDAG